MRSVTASEIAKLGERYEMRIGEAELDDVTDCVNAFVEGLGKIYEIPVEETTEDGGRCGWQYPEDDPNNAISGSVRGPSHRGEFRRAGRSHDWN